MRTPLPLLPLDVAGIENWDLHPDDKRFVVAARNVAPIAADSAIAASRYLVVLNWFSELKAAAKAAPR